MRRLDDYLARTASLPWAWGAQDCTIWAADWCVIRWGIDPAARYRGQYSDEAGADRIVGASLLDAVSPEITLRRKSVPDTGDIGIIEIMGRQTSAIWTGAHWAFRTLRGIGMTKREAIAVWGD